MRTIYWATSRQASRSGWPTFVLTRYISPTLRSSCCWVATFVESGDHDTIARSLLLQPALSVAYPKYRTPSVVSARSAPVFMSRSQRFQSRTNTARDPSGATLSGFPSDDGGPPPRPPRPAPRPPPRPLPV